MPNDDLGTFPMPPKDSIDPATPVTPAQPTSQPTNPPIQEEVPPVPVPPQEVSLAPEPITFEETPEEIPSSQPSPAYLSQTRAQPAAEIVPPSPQPEQIQQPTPPTPIPAALPPKSRSSAAPVIIFILLIVAGAGLAAAAFLSAQTNKLKAQLIEITQTLEKQQTTLTPTATPTVFEIPTPTIATQGATITPTSSDIPIVTPNLNSLLPLQNASSILQIAIKHSPNAQLILIKIDNAADATTAVTKYFFREDTTTKKYFYVAVTGNGTPEVVDKQIYVTPDDNIPTLNDAVLSNKLGLELNDAIALSITQCADQTACSAAPIKAQYIKTGSGIIWQLSLYTNGLSGTPLTIQINSLTKEILYKSPEFAKK